MRTVKIFRRRPTPASTGRWTRPNRPRDQPVNADELLALRAQSAKKRATLRRVARAAAPAVR